MAINIIQSPMANPGGYIQMLTGSIYPLYSTWDYTPIVDLYTDFKYYIDLITEDGILNTFTSVGEDNTNWSKISVSDFVKNSLTNVFQPTVNTIHDNPNSILNYQLVITPWNENARITTDSATTMTMFGIKSSNMEYQLDYFLSTDEDKMLVNIDHHYYTTDTYATNKALFGHFGYTNGSVFNSQFTKIVYEVTKPNGTIETYELPNELVKYTPTSDMYLDTTENLLTEIPIGPKNLYSVWAEQTIVLPNGYTFYNQNARIIIEDGDKYRYAAFDNNTQVSKWYNITVRNCTTRYTPMPVSWLTEFGAYDTFVFYAKSEKTVGVKNSTYVKSPYSRVGNYYYIEKTTDRGETIYEQEIDETYEIISDWITDDEVTELESLWTSPDTYIQLNGEHYPVNSITKKQVINSKGNVGLFQYKFDVKISTKKYRL